MSNADVELIAPFEGRINAGKVGTDELADAAVTKPKLSTGFLKVAVINGGAAGTHTVTGIATGDALISVLHLPDAGAVDTIVALTGEFTITAADTINNTGGTASTNGKLLVIYQDRA